MSCVCSSLRGASRQRDLEREEVIRERARIGLRKSRRKSQMMEGELAGRRKNVIMGTKANWFVPSFPSPLPNDIMDSFSETRHFYPSTHMFSRSGNQMGLYLPRRERKRQLLSRRYGTKASRVLSSYRIKSLLNTVYYYTTKLHPLRIFLSKGGSVREDRL